MDIAAQSLHNGASVNLWSYHGYASQLWVIKQVKEGEYTITNMFSGKALEIQNGNNFNGSKVQLYDYNRNNFYATQRWRIEYPTTECGDDFDAIKFVNVNSNLCLDVMGGRQIQGVLTHAWQNYDTPAQKFELIQMYTLVNDSIY